MSDTASRTSDGSERSELRFEREFVLRFASAIRSSVAESQRVYLENEDYARACSASIQPSDYTDPEHFAEDYQVVELLKKSLNIPGYDLSRRQSAALSKFLGCEARNAETNTRLWCNRNPEWFGRFSAELLRILGPLDSKALTEIADHSKFGPGACVGVRSEGLVPSIKYEANPVVTRELSPFLKTLMPAYVLNFKGGAESVAERTVIAQGNHHFTVPKNYEIERCAAKEPLWNSFLQLGIGAHIVRRLKRFGVDLHDQGRNQLLASLALSQGLATIDLSSASDLMSRVLVKLALTYNGAEQGNRWLHLLELARSKSMKIDGELKPLEMFSSMGNGFTFPLETAIFLAVIRTVVPSEELCRSTCYGDDIIIPQQYAALLIERLEYLGFKVNGKKTCLAGEFFESCGTDWFRGCNVRPFYLHKDPHSQIPYALSVANALRAWCIRIYGYLPEKFSGVWRWCTGQIPTSFRNPVPKEYGDVGLHVGITEALARGVTIAASKHQWWEGYNVQVARLRPVMKDRHTPGVLIPGINSMRPWAPGDAFKLGTLSLREYALTQQRIQEPPFSTGLEPVRGLFGKVRTEWLVVLWKDDFCW